MLSREETKTKKTEQKRKIKLCKCRERCALWTTIPKSRDVCSATTVRRQRSVFPHCHLFSCVFFLATMLDNNKMNIHSAKRFIHYEKRFLCCTIMLRSLSLFFDAQHLFSFFLAMLVCVLIVCAQFVSCFVRGRKREKDCVFGKNMNAHLSWCAFFAHGDLLLGICVHQYPCLGVNVLVSIPFLLAHKM